MIVIDQHGVKHEQLSNGVDYVNSFDQEIGGYEIVTVEPATNDTADLRDEVFYSYAAAGTVVALSQEVAVHVVDDVAYCLLADLEIGCL